MVALQDLIAQTPVGGTLNLEGRRFDIVKPVMVKKPINIVGPGTVVLALAPDRELSNFIFRGSGIHLSGNVTVVGSKPTGHDYDASREAQHGLWLQSVSDFSCDGWHVQNTWGDAVYVGKAYGTTDWSKNVKFSNLTTSEIGRQHMTLVAADTVQISHFNFGKGYRSVFDIEPPGSDWGAKNVLISQGTVSSPHGYLLSSKGVGNSTSVHDIHLDQITCHNRLIDGMILPPTGVRRQNFSITNCVSNIKAHSVPLRFNHVDGITLKGNTQPLDPGIAFFTATDCTKVVSA
jgi:hypothetical protein